MTTTATGGGGGAANTHNRKAAASSTCLFSQLDVDVVPFGFLLYFLRLRLLQCLVLLLLLVVVVFFVLVSSRVVHTRLRTKSFL